MEILCTNDDGVMSPGLAAAVRAASNFGNVWVAAPSSQKTGAGRSLIGDRTKPFSTVDLRVGADTITAFHREATPAMVVRHAFYTVLHDVKIDLAISGINYGENIGYDIGNSGTVGAAMECATREVPAIAVSMQTEVTGHRSYGDVDWAAAQFFLGESIRRFIEKGGFHGFDVLKLDVPMGADERTEWKVCALHRNPYYLARISKHSPDAMVAETSLYLDESSYMPGTDAYVLIKEKKVAVVPLLLDWSAAGTGDYFT
ncbi:MAG: 5'/3'-nucleotidase SurE [Spirochaetia bacterium]